MSRRLNTTSIFTLALGSSVLIAVMNSTDGAHRLPVGVRTAFELIATKSGQNNALRREALHQQ
jgi:hypothetical protein